MTPYRAMVSSIRHGRGIMSGNGIYVAITIRSPRMREMRGDANYRSYAPGDL